MVDAPAGHLLEQIQQIVPVGHRPLADGAVAERPGLTAQPGEKAGQAHHLQVEGADPLGPLRRLDPRQLFQPRGVQIFVERRFGHRDPAHHRKVLDPGPALHELLEAPVQIAHMGLAFHHLVAAQGELQRHVAGDAGVLGAMPELDVLLGVQVDDGLAVHQLRVLGTVGRGHHFYFSPSSG